MALIRWEPVAELNTIQNEMNRLFNTFFDQPDRTGRGSGRRCDGGFRRWTSSRPTTITSCAPISPGFSDGDVNVQLEDNVLTISGERKAEHEDEQEGYYRLERAFGGFSRSLTLPDGVDPDGIEAHFDRGVLEIRDPQARAEEAQDRADQPRRQPPTPRRSRAPTRRPTAATQSPRLKTKSLPSRDPPTKSDARTAGWTAAVRAQPSMSSAFADLWPLLGRLIGEAGGRPTPSTTARGRTWSGYGRSGIYDFA